MATNHNLEAALRYLDLGFSVIPIIPGEKKPLISWQPFQKQRADRNQIISWWSQKQNANIGIVTGEISDLFVVDIDTEEGHTNLNQYGFDSIITPTVKTPRGGQHLYFKYPKGKNITIGAGKIPGTDFRGNGGYVLAPPSVNGNGNPYEWVIDLDTPFATAIPDSYIKIISTLYIGNVDNLTSDCLQTSTLSTNVYNAEMWEVGRRDDSLFHVAWCFAKAKTTKDVAFQTLMAITNSWGEHDEKWVRDKIESAWKRAEGKERNLALEIREFILSTDVAITSTNIYKSLQVSTREEKKNVSIILKRLSEGEKPILKRQGREGYALIDQDEEIIDWENADTTPLNIKFPLKVHEYVSVHKGNVIIIAGESNAGKTAYCLNMAYLNKDIMPVKYMSSEMQDGTELKIRIQEFNHALSNWKPISFSFRTDNFPDKINPDGLNIIDYLDEGMDGEAYKMPIRIRMIADKLKTGIAVIAIQKDPNKELGFGGSGTLNRARVYLTIKREGILKIEKAKIWRDKNDNPNGKYINFKLAAGCRFKPETEEWIKD